MPLLRNHKLLIVLLLFVSVFNFYFFGYLDHKNLPLEGDESEYHGYASNIAVHGFYSVNGKDFSAWREPGYMLVIAVIYKLFGVGNVFAVQIFHAILIWGAALLVYLGFIREKQPKLGMMGAIMVAANPYFAYLAVRLQTEMFFSFLIILVLYLILNIKKTDNPTSAQFICLGFAIGWLALSRLQSLYIPFFLIAIGYIKQNPFSIFTGKNALKLFIGFMIPIMSWSLYCYSQTGKLMLQEGRADIQIFVRAERTHDSWSKLFHYAGQQIKSTFFGDRDESWWLEDYRYIILKYDPEIYTRDNSIKTILANPAKYLFGNSIEFLKTISVNHVYKAPHFSKYLRPPVYVILYGTFLVAGYYFIKKRYIPDIAAFALFLLSYNLIIISFFNGSSIYNVQFHVLYTVIGVSGMGGAMIGKKNP